MKKVFVFLILATLLLVGCEKTPVVPPIPPIVVTRTVLVGKIGKGTVNPDTLTKVVYGESLTITATPDPGNSLYSVKVSYDGEEKNIEITPTASSFQYTLPEVKFNTKVVFEFVETDNLIISVLNPPWRLKAMEDFYPDGELLFSWPLTEEILSQMFYFYYPEGKVEAFYPNGTLCFNGPWSLKERVLKIGNYYFNILELTPTRLVYERISSGGFRCRYAYERN